MKFMLFLFLFLAISQSICQSTSPDSAKTEQTLKPRITPVNEIQVGKINCTNVLLYDVLLQLNTNTKVAFGIEDRVNTTTIPNTHTLGALRVMLRTTANEDLKTFLGDLSTKYPILKWDVEEGIIVISAKDVKDNPLNKTVTAFSTHGTFSDCLHDMSHHGFGFGTTLGTGVLVSGSLPCDLEVPTQRRASEVLSMLTAQYGITWYASVADDNTPIDIGNGSGGVIHTSIDRLKVALRRSVVPRLVSE